MRSIDQFLNRKIAEKKLLIEQLNAAVLPLLPASCRDHITTSNYCQQELTLIADSPVWAARLRTQHREICKSISNKLKLPVQSIKIRFNQPVRSRKPDTSPAPRLSRQSSELIRKTADSISDTALKEAMHRLAKNAD